MTVRAVLTIGSDSSRRRLAALLLSLLAQLISASSLSAQQDDPSSQTAANPLPNAGFEDGEQQWQIKDAISQVTAEAASSGTMGLRVGAEQSPGNGSSVMSAKVGVTTRQAVTLTFWGRAKVNCAGVYLIFQNDAGNWLKSEGLKAGGGHPMVGIKKSDDNAWQEYTLQGTAPADATHVAIWIHSYSGTLGTTDIDDLVLSGITPGAAVIPVGATQRPAAQKQIDPADMPARQTPPVIILKLDDLKQHRGKPVAHWDRVVNYLDSRQIKASIGVICQTLEEATPQYIAWIKDRHATGRWEFWFHGWDHAVHEEDGTKYNEFNHRSYDEQKKRLDDSQRLAQEKLGFAFTTFGPPGGVGNGSFDDNTIRVMADDPYITTWLYPQPINDAGRALEAAGKVVILDRVWAVNLEGGVGAPDFNRFLQGYAKHLDRPYFVLQGHPPMWNDDRFAEFEKIIDFLVAQNATFLTPTEYAAIRRTQGSP